MLSCRVGLEYVEDVESAVQSALMSVIENWTFNGILDDTSAWLFRVANNHLLDARRTRMRRRRILQQNATDASPKENALKSSLPDEVQGDRIRMMSVCCDETITLESQLVFTRKTLCGFDVREISIRLSPAKPASTSDSSGRATACVNYVQK